ncbi:MAG: hypothetical protein CM1200mP30_22340 [Pseudomonadota bacterium]|nr:MAG: hypothetical protein CM1200mP30_22340 [Pseudomonadota bacterium]
MRMVAGLEEPRRVIFSLAAKGLMMKIPKGWDVAMVFSRITDFIHICLFMKKIRYPF